MKNRSQLLVLGLLLVMFLTACKPETSNAQGTIAVTPKENKTPQAQGTPTPTKMPEISTDAKGLAGVQISYLHPWSGETGRVMDLLVDEFNQSNEWGVHVLTREPGSTGLAIQDLRASEIGAVNVAALPNYELLFQDQNQLPVVDLNPYVSSASVGFAKEELSDFSEVFWDQNIVEGKLVGIPAQQTAAVLFYNNSWAKELGYSSIPQTAQAFRLQTCSANAALRKDNDYYNDGLGGWLISPDSDSLFSWLLSFNAVDLSSPIEKIYNAKTREGFVYLFNLNRDACAWSGRIAEPYDYFASRQALAYSGTTQDILPQAAAFERSGLTDEWQVISYPRGAESAVLTSGLVYGVFKSDDQKELASWLFIRWLSQPENQARLLETSGSLPLGSKVMEYMTSFEEQHSQWTGSLSLIPQSVTLPAQANEGIIRMVLGDAGTFLFKPEFTTEQISELILQLDATIQELTDYQP